ncbi:MerR family transcriptional regulator [Priestia megaterium]|uniref:MerR family transcriptional regulator n=1 Tax=Priestia megaterium TaxID=1404 RepID=UPI0038B22BBF
MGKNAYTTKQVADNLSVSTSALRKWCLMLEDAEYRFERNEKNNRVFYDHDMLALRHLKKLTQDDGKSLENAIKAVSDMGRARQDVTGSDSEKSEQEAAVSPDVLKRYEDKIDMLEDKLDKLLDYIEKQDARFDAQERFNRELISELKNQQGYINESLNTRDQQLVAAMKEAQEAKRLAAASAEEKEESRKGFFARLLGK